MRIEVFNPPPSTLVLAEWTARLGQNLFYPPNVGGWPGGRTWVTSQCLIGRIDFAESLVQGKLFERDQSFSALALAEQHGQGKSRESVPAFFSRLLLGVDPIPAWHGKLASLNPAETARRVVAFILSSPEAQLA